MTLGNLSLVNTLPVGQSFLWHRVAHEDGEEFSRAVDRPPRVVCLRQSTSHLFYTAVYPNAADEAKDYREGITRSWLNDYFQLARYPDMEKLYAEWRARDPALFGKVDLERAAGIRVLRQDPWECLVA